MTSNDEGQQSGTEGRRIAGTDGTGLGIGDNVMVCRTSTHHAHRVDTGWELDWLPGRVFTRNQAITALMAAEQIAAHPDGDRRIYQLVRSWLVDELQLAADDWPSK